MPDWPAPQPSHAQPPSFAKAWEVLLAFLKLGLTAFGGPVAHLGHLRTEFVERRRWLSDAAYSDLVALCQFLPGPASSQVGMALGLRRAGAWGALAAWVGFTLPSALALIAFAHGATQWVDGAGAGVLQGLKVVAVAVVAQAVWGMARSLCPDAWRAGIAVAALGWVWAWPTALGQVAALVLGGLIAHWALRLPALPPMTHEAVGIGRRTGAVLLGLFVVLLLLLPLMASVSSRPEWAAVSVFYQAGALVFGGGHVVLPWLQSGVVPPGWVSHEVFVAGYGAAQAVPGPLFTFAAYLGAAMPAPWGGWSGGLALLAVIFLPAFLVLAGALPFWELLRQRAGVQRAMAGVNAAVVGVLAAAWVDPVATSALHGSTDVALALGAFALLVWARWSPVAVVALAAALGGVWGG
jgi:chromate transporter